MRLNIPSSLIVLIIILSILAFANSTISPSTVGTDYLSSQKLTSDQMKMVQVTVSDEDALLDISGKIPSLTPPLLVNWQELADCSSGKNPVFLLFHICVNMTKGCKGGIVMCYVGKMDPIYSPHLEPNYILKNLEGKLDKRCDKTNKMIKFWEKKELHSVQFSSLDGLSIEIEASFTQMHQSLVPNAEGCIEMLIASENSLIGQIRDGRNKNFVGQNLSAFLYNMGNGDALANQDLSSSLPFDLLGKFYNKYSPHLPLFAFAGSDDCEMHIKIDGPLKHCADQKCTSIIDIYDKQQIALYKKEFEKMKPLYKIEDLPSQYNNIVFFVRNPKDNLPRAIIEIRRGNEIPFSVLTRNLTPPVLVFLFPRNYRICTIERNFDVNEFVLAYNGRPDCYFRIAFGERKYRFRAAIWQATFILGRMDMHVRIEGSEFWGHDQFGDKQMLGRGTCSFHATELAKPFEGLKLHGYRWDFIINPKKNAKVPIVDDSNCELAMAIDLVDYRIMLGDEEHAKTTVGTTMGTTEAPDELEL